MTTIHIFIAIILGIVVMPFIVSYIDLKLEKPEKDKEKQRFKINLLSWIQGFFLMIFGGFILALIILCLFCIWQVSLMLTPTK